MPVHPGAFGKFGLGNRREREHGVRAVRPPRFRPPRPPLCFPVSSLELGAEGLERRTTLHLQKTSEICHPAVSDRTVMANIEAESGHAEQLRLLGIELLCGEHARVPECCQLR
jgi:hypothetical protein